MTAADPMDSPLATVRRLPVLALLAALPAAASAQSATAEPAGMPVGSMLQLVAALGLVLAAVFAAAWVLRRVSGLQVSSGAVRVIGGAAVGSRERVVLVEVAETWLVVGVAPGSVSALATLPKGEAAGVAAAVPSPGAPFQQWLRSVIEKRNGPR